MSAAGILKRANSSFVESRGGELSEHMFEMADEATRRVLVQNNQPTRQMRWTLHGWVNVDSPGDFNRMHTHPGSTWSGTYYDIGDPFDPESGTPLHLFDLCQGHANFFLPPRVASSFLVRPEPGLMVQFPSDVPHMVFAHQGNRPRVSIAFSLRKEPFP